MYANTEHPVRHCLSRLAIQRLGQGHFSEVLGLAGDHSKRCAWDLTKFVSLDVDLKRIVIMWLAGRG